MRYETANEDVIFYSENLGVAICFNRQDYEHLYQKQGKYHVSDRELAETYPGAKSYLKEQLKKEKQWLKELLDPIHIYEIKEHTRGCHYSYKKEEEVNIVRITHHQNQIEKSKTKIKKLENIIYFMDNKKVLDGDIEMKIKQAKAVPISSLLSFNGMGFAKCPFHNETNSSLKYYPKSNTYHCYGCNVGGDSIDFIMRLKGLKFLEAIKYLG